MTCPVNGPREISEFQCLGPRRTIGRDDPDTILAHLFAVENAFGPMVEWWRHRPSNTVFLAERHTVTDEILRTWVPDGTEASHA